MYVIDNVSLRDNDMNSIEYAYVTDECNCCCDICIPVLGCCLWGLCGTTYMYMQRVSIH